MARRKRDPSNIPVESDFRIVPADAGAPAGDTAREIEAVTSAISASAANRPRKEGTRQRFRRYAVAAIEALDRVRADSARGEDDPASPGYDERMARLMGARGEDRCASCGCDRAWHAADVRSHSFVSAREDHEGDPKVDAQAAWADREHERCEARRSRGEDHEAAMEAAREAAERAVMNVGAWRDIAEPVVDAYLSRARPLAEARASLELLRNAERRPMD